MYNDYKLLRQHFQHTLPPNLKNLVKLVIFLSTNLEECHAQFSQVPMGSTKSEPISHAQSHSAMKHVLASLFLN